MTEGRPMRPSIRPTPNPTNGAVSRPPFKIPPSNLGSAPAGFRPSFRPATTTAGYAPSSIRPTAPTPPPQADGNNISHANGNLNLNGGAGPGNALQRPFRPRPPQALQHNIQNQNHQSAAQNQNHMPSQNAHQIQQNGLANQFAQSLHVSPQASVPPPATTAPPSQSLPHQSQNHSLPAQSMPHQSMAQQSMPPPQSMHQQSMPQQPPTQPPSQQPYQQPPQRPMFSQQTPQTNGNMNNMMSPRGMPLRPFIPSPKRNPVPQQQPQMPHMNNVSNGPTGLGLNHQNGGNHSMMTMNQNTSQPNIGNNTVAPPPHQYPNQHQPPPQFQQNRFPTQTYINNMPSPNPSQQSPGQIRPSLYQPSSLNSSPASIYSDMTSSSYNSPFNQPSTQRTSTATSQAKIDPDQIPSVVSVRGEDQEKFGATGYKTSSRIPPPLATTNYRVFEEGSCNPRFIRSTLYNIPSSEELLKLSHIPMGIMVQPLADLGPGEGPLPTVDFGESGPVRCSRCQAYANPFMNFTNGGKLFLCNLCGFENEVSPAYFSNLDMNGRRIDIQNRPELMHGSVEFAVQGPYCARPPEPASYLFCVDVSWNAIQSGMLATFTMALHEFLYGGAHSLPTGVRVGILTFDRHLHFYNLKAGLDVFQMMVVADIDDPFCPFQDGLFVDPHESRTVIEGLLAELPKMFAGNAKGDSAVGSAMRAAFDALKGCGGKLSVFQTMLPTIGLGALKMREDSNILGTDKEKTLFEPQDYFWTKLGQDCAAGGVGVDMYLFPSSNYIDVATLGAVPALSGGEIYYYRGFDVSRQGYKFANNLKLTLSRTFGFDSVLRVRVSNGVKIDDYFGNFYMKNATDIECAGVDSLKAFGMVLKHETKLSERQDVHVQAALLYTTAEGFRRVRVHNIVFTVTSQLSLLFRGSSLETSACILARQMVQKAVSTPLSTIRSNLTTQITKILVSYRSNCASPSSPGQLILPESFKLGPITSLTILKTRAFRLGKIGSSDLRVYSMRLLNSLGVSELAAYLYPTMFDCTEPIPDQEIGPQMFPILRLSVMRLITNGMYIAENGRHLFLFVGKDVPPPTLQNVFGVSSLESIPILNDLPPVNHVHNTQVRNAITYLRSHRPRFMHLSICRQGIDQGVEGRFGNLLLEDTNFDNPSYVDYLIQVHRGIQTEIINNQRG